MLVEMEMKVPSDHMSSNPSFHSADESSLVSVKTGCMQLSPGSTRGKRWQMFQLLLLNFIPITILIVQNSVLLVDVVSSLNSVEDINEQIAVTVHVAKLLSELQYERAELAYYIFSTKNGRRLELHSRFNQTDELLENMSAFIENAELSGKNISFQNHILDLYARRKKILSLAKENDSTCDDEALEEMVWYNQANDLIMDQLARKIRDTNTGLWRSLVAYKNMIKAIENFSISMVYGFYYFCKGHLTSRSLAQYVKYDSLAEDYLNSTIYFSTDVFDKYGKFEIDYEAFQLLKSRQTEIYRNVRMTPVTANAEKYFNNMIDYIKLLRTYQWHLRDIVSTQLQDEIHGAKTSRAYSAIILSVIVVLGPILILLVRNVTDTMQNFSTLLSKKTAALNAEKRKSDRLLSQMLPIAVVKELKQRRQVPAEAFDSVTIYFSDIVNFTRLSSTSSPMEIVIMLNSLYQVFDSRIEHYDVYKVETIGDAYMVVSGLPIRNGYMHAGEICTMALDLMAGVRNFYIPHRPTETLSIRVGINTGPCVAGVIGTKMPRYCLFGDSINTASRMESNGQAMKIHISDETKQVLDIIGGYITESRGILDIKGKGQMCTYWLTGKEGGLPRTLEMSTPGFFKPILTPDFVKEIFGDDDDSTEENSTSLNDHNKPNSPTVSHRPMKTTVGP